MPSALASTRNANGVEKKKRNNQDDTKQIHDEKPSDQLKSTDGLREVEGGRERETLLSLWRESTEPRERERRLSLPHNACDDYLLFFSLLFSQRVGVRLDAVLPMGLVSASALPKDKPKSSLLPRLKRVPNYSAQQ